MMIQPQRPCEHSRRRHSCIECSGNGICKHSKRRSRCKECRGGAARTPRTVQQAETVSEGTMDEGWKVLCEDEEFRDAGGLATRRGRGFRNHTLRRARPQRRVVAVSYLLERPCRRGATRHRCYADGDCCIRITVCGFMRRGFPRHAADRLQAPMPPRPARETHMRRPCG